MHTPKIKMKFTRVIEDDLCGYCSTMLGVDDVVL